MSKGGHGTAEASRTGRTATKNQMRALISTAPDDMRSAVSRATTREVYLLPFVDASDGGDFTGRGLTFLGLSRLVADLIFQWWATTPRPMGLRSRATGIGTNTAMESDP